MAKRIVVNGHAYDDRPGTTINIDYVSRQSGDRAVYIVETSDRGSRGDYIETTRRYLGKESELGTIRTSTYPQFYNRPSYGSGCVEEKTFVDSIMTGICAAFFLGVVFFLLGMIVFPIPVGLVIFFCDKIGINSPNLFFVLGGFLGLSIIVGAIIGFIGGYGDTL